jgi:hypothetical protein
VEGVETAARRSPASASPAWSRRCSTRTPTGLRALRVELGDGRELSVVCGAPNARTGMKGVLALPGAFIPGTGITLKPARSAA